MQNHEYYRELCALAAIGQLSSEEDRELSQHLCSCVSCGEVNAGYAHVVQHQLPQADPIRSRMKDLIPKAAPDGDLRDRFLARARAEGIEFSADVERPAIAQRGGPWFLRHWQPVFATAAIAVIAVMGVTNYRLHVPNTSVAQRSENEMPSAYENEALRERIASLEAAIESGSVKLKQAERSDTLDQESLAKLQGQLAEAREEARKLETDLQKSRSDYAELASADQQKDSLVAALHTDNEKLHHDNASIFSTVVIQESRIRDLNDAIEQQASNFERERQLLTASKDVRQLMGARNLHIMDVHDTDGAGKSAKALGRVFYAEGQSLIFYAFDLPSGKLTPAKYTFQAWGQKESESHSIRNLGTFAVDDHEQRRWVLKVNDSKLLQGIDSVFVTAEALGDTGEPRGKKILYAYIVGEPNHP